VVLPPRWWPTDREPITNITDIRQTDGEKLALDW
jgi:hypothetical protein